jgi:hypothetical protein
LKPVRFLVPALFFFCAVSAAEPVAMSPSVILANYTAAAETLKHSLRGAQMEIDIEASLPKLKKTGRLHALRRISEIGRITYDALRFEGDGTVKKNVIARYLAAESQAGEESAQKSDLSITPANYKFKYKGERELDGRTAHLFELSPRKKRVGLFKGELWIDAETYLPLRESGQFVKNPSIFLKKVAFVRDYDIVDGRAVPRQIQSTIDTRLVGKAELLIHYRNLSFDTETHLSLDAGSGI